MAVRKMFALLGADNTGKTEFGTALCDLFGWTYYKNLNEGQNYCSGNEDPNLAFKYETQTVFNFLHWLPYSQVILFDRSTPCQFVYSKALNRSFDENLIWEFDEKFANLGMKWIYCYKTKYEKPFEDEWVSEDIQANVEKYYEEYLAKTKCKFAKIDMTSCDLVFEFAQLIASEILWS